MEKLIVMNYSGNPLIFPADNVARHGWLRVKPFLSSLIWCREQRGTSLAEIHSECSSKHAAVTNEPADINLSLSIQSTQPNDEAKLADFALRRTNSQNKSEAEAVDEKTNTGDCLNQTTSEISVACLIAERDDCNRNFDGNNKSAHKADNGVEDGESCSKAGGWALFESVDNIGDDTRTVSDRGSTLNNRRLEIRLVETSSQLSPTEISTQKSIQKPNESDLAAKQRKTSKKRKHAKIIIYRKKSKPRAIGYLPMRTVDMSTGTDGLLSARLEDRLQDNPPSNMKLERFKSNISLKKPATFHQQSRPSIETEEGGEDQDVSSEHMVANRRWSRKKKVAYIKRSLQLPVGVYVEMDSDTRMRHLQHHSKERKLQLLQHQRDKLFLDNWRKKAEKMQREMFFEHVKASLNGRREHDSVQGRSQYIADPLITDFPYTANVRSDRHRPRNCVRSWCKRVSEGDILCEEIKGLADDIEKSHLKQPLSSLSQRKHATMRAEKGATMIELLHQYRCEHPLPDRERYKTKRKLATTRLA